MIKGTENSLCQITCFESQNSVTAKQIFSQFSRSTPRRFTVLWPGCIMGGMYLEHSVFIPTPQWRFYWLEILSWHSHLFFETGPVQNLSYEQVRNCSVKKCNNVFCVRQNTKLSVCLLSIFFLSKCHLKLSWQCRSGQKKICVFTIANVHIWIKYNILYIMLYQKIMMHLMEHGNRCYETIWKRIRK